MSFYVATLYMERTNSLVRIDVIEPHGLMRPEPQLRITLTDSHGAVEAEQYPFYPSDGGLDLYSSAVSQALGRLTLTERGGGRVTYFHYSPDFDPTGLECLLSGINLGQQIMDLTTTRTVQ